MALALPIPADAPVIRIFCPHRYQSTASERMGCGIETVLLARVLMLRKFWREEGKCETTETGRRVIESGVEGEREENVPRRED
jgi:hypothetical protein